jgi:cell division protein FtsQ
LLGKPKTFKTRKNRYTKKKSRQPGRLFRRLMLLCKLGGLIGALLAVSAFFMVVYAAVTQSDYFRTQTITVSGNSRLSAQAVIAQAHLAPGDNLLAVNLHLVRQRLLSHPWIAAARVSREIPETITIQIQEHVPLAVVDMGRRFLINTGGRIFKEQDSGDPQDLPVVTGMTYSDISLGDDPLTAAMQAVVAVLSISRGRHGRLSSDAIAQLSYDAELGVTLMSDQRRFRLGFDAFEAKFDRLDRLVSYLIREKQWSRVKSVDVNDPDRVVVQLGSSTTLNEGA